MTENEIKLSVQANDFKRTNGIVVRTIAALYPVNFFEFHDIEAAVKSRNIDKEELKTSIDYLEGQGYIEVRHIGTKKPVRFCDLDDEDVEIKLSSKGTLVVLSIEKDAGIDI
jgi:hypothetical protein